MAWHRSWQPKLRLKKQSKIRKGRGEVLPNIPRPSSDCAVVAEPADAPALGAGGCLSKRNNTRASSILGYRNIILSTFWLNASYSSNFQYGSTSANRTQ